MTRWGSVVVCSAMLPLLLLACSLGSDSPPAPPYVAETTNPVPTPAEVRAALEHAAPTVRPADVGDLSGRWSQPEQAIGQDLHVEGHIRRHPVQPGVIGFGMAASYRAEQPLVVMAFEGIEVYGSDQVCGWWTESRVEWSNGTPEAAALARLLTTDALNQGSCADVVELTHDRIVMEQGDVRWSELKHD